MKRSIVPTLRSGKTSALKSNFVDMTDEELLRERGADSEAIVRQIITERYREFGVKCLCRQFPDAGLDFELTVDKVLSACCKTAQYHNLRSTFKTLFYSSLFREARQQKKVNRNRKNRDEAYEMERFAQRVSTDWPEEALLTNAEKSPLLEALDNLSADDRALIMAGIYFGMSLKETAVCLGISEAAVRKRKERILKKLREDNTLRQHYTDA